MSEFEKLLKGGGGLTINVSDGEESNLNLLPLLSSDFQTTPIVSIKFEEGKSSTFGDLTFEKLIQDITLKESFEASFKESLAKDLDVNPDNIRIIKISKGSIDV